jgi:hypothetical protein
VRLDGHRRQGAVGAVSLIEAPGCQPPGTAPQALADSIRQTLLQWRFEPARFCHYADPAARRRAAGGCDVAATSVQPVPVSLAWAFTFQIRDGQREVVQRQQGR